MKVRASWVTNSSPSSFLISKRHLTLLQIDQIHNHIEVAKEIWDDGDAFYDDAWSVVESDKEIAVYTMMDNFGMYDFLIAIGVSAHEIERGYY